MSDDSVVSALSGFSGFAAGLRDVLVPHMQAKYENSLAIQRDAAKRQKDLDAAKELETFKGSIAPKTVSISRDEETGLVIPGSEFTTKAGEKIDVFKKSREKPIPITPEEKQGQIQKAKLKSSMPQAKARLANAIADIDAMVGSVRKIKKSPGLNLATGWTSFSGNIPGSPMADVAADLESLQSKIFISTLQNMRENSKTGGAVGNVSDREGDRLASVIASTKRSKSTKGFIASLDEIESTGLSAKQRLINAFNEQYGDSISMPTIGEDNNNGGSKSSLLDTLINEHK